VSAPATICGNLYQFTPHSSLPISRSEFFEETFEPLMNAPTWDAFTFDRISLFFAMLSVGVLLDFGTEARHAYAYRLHKTGGKPIPLGNTEICDFRT